jgi:hypothetical protein
VGLRKVWSNSRGLEGLKAGFWRGLYKCGRKAGVRASTEEVVKEIGVSMPHCVLRRKRRIVGLRKVWSNSRGLGGLKVGFWTGLYKCGRKQGSEHLLKKWSKKLGLEGP